MSFKDYFSGQASSYQAYRPSYPDDLFAFLASLAGQHNRAWDCATGNGQAAIGLAPYFAEVIATDASAAQIARAEPHQKIRYKVAPAEDSGLAPASIDLITVAQAAHWFDLDAFYREVQRVAAPGAVISIWAYGMAEVSPAVDAVVQKLYGDIVGSFWPPERNFIEDKYETLPFPFEQVEVPTFEMRTTWTFSRLVGYLSTWSAVARYREAKGIDPVAMLQGELESAWGQAKTREIVWPLILKAGRVRV